MTNTFGKKFIACAALSTLAFASSAHAGNAFNKFPEQSSASHTQGFQVTTYATPKTSTTTVVTTKRRIKRVVKPVPAAVSNRVSYASDNGTSNMKSGFNKMVHQSNASSNSMPIFIDNRANTAR